MPKKNAPEVRTLPELTPLQRILAEIMDRYDLGFKDMAGVLGVLDNEIYAFLRGTRNLQKKHLIMIIDYLRGYAANAQPWTQHDEYVLLSTFVHGQLPDLGEEGHQAFDRRRFKLGGHEKAAIVYEFVEEGYERQLLHCSLDASPIAPYGDAELDEKYQRLFAENRISIGMDPDPFNGAGMTLSYIHTTRTDGDERPQVIMRFKPSDYVRRVTTRTIFSELPEDRRTQIVTPIHTTGVQEAYCGGFGAVISLITADRKLLFFQRSSKVGGDRGEYDCTVVEAMNGTKDRDLNGQPSVIMNAVRGLAEEAGLDVYQDDLLQRLRFHGFLCRSRYYEWAIYGSLDLSSTSFTTDHLMSNALESWRRKRPKNEFAMSQSSEGLSTSFALARDAFEFQRYTAVPFTLRDVVRFIATNPVADYSFVSAVMTLASVLNVSTRAVDRELRLYRPQPSEEERESRTRDQRHS